MTYNNPTNQQAAGCCSSNGGFALLGRRLGHILVEKGLENLDRLREGLVGTGLALGIPSLMLNTEGHEYPAHGDEDCEDAHPNLIARKPWQSMTCLTA